MDQPRAVLFDLDGTLIDTTGLILACFEHSWRTICSHTHPPEVLIDTFGMPLRSAMQMLLARLDGKANNPELMIDKLIGEYRRFNLANHDRLAKPFPGVSDIVGTLKARGYAVGVVTSKSTELGRRGLKLFDLDHMVDASVFLEDTERHKPDPHPISAALERLGVAPESAAYVGDSPFDVMAGRAAGVRTVAALWGPSPRASLAKQAPDHLAETVSDLLHIFE